MLETLIFREIRYSDNNEELLKESIEKLKDNPNDVKTLQTLASTYHALKENDKAIEIYEKLIKLQPENQEIWAFLGYLHYENEDFSKACKNLEKALDLCPTEPFVLFLLGNIYSRKGKITKAVECYEMAIFFDFDMYIAHIDFARKYEHMGRHKKALDEYKAAYGIDSRDEGLAEKIKYLENKYKKYLNDEKIS